METFLEILIEYVLLGICVLVGCIGFYIMLTSLYGDLCEVYSWLDKEARRLLSK